MKSTHYLKNDCSSTTFHNFDSCDRTKSNSKNKICHVKSHSSFNEYKINYLSKSSNNKQNILNNASVIDSILEPSNNIKLKKLKGNIWNSSKENMNSLEIRGYEDVNKNTINYDYVDRFLQTKIDLVAKRVIMKKDANLGSMKIKKLKDFESQSKTNYYTLLENSIKNEKWLMQSQRSKSNISELKDTKDKIDEFYINPFWSKIKLDNKNKVKNLYKTELKIRNNINQNINLKVTDNFLRKESILDEYIINKKNNKQVVNDLYNERRIIHNAPILEKLSEEDYRIIEKHHPNAIVSPNFYEINQRIVFPKIIGDSKMINSVYNQNLKKMDKFFGKTLKRKILKAKY